MCTLKERSMNLGPLSIISLITCSIGSTIFLVWLYRNYMIYFLMSLSIVIVIISALFIWTFIYIYRRVVRNKVEIHNQKAKKEEPTIIILADTIDKGPKMSFVEKKQRKENITKKLAPFIYYGEITDEKCGATGLKLSMVDEIVKCPNCYTYFRIQDLLEKMIYEEICPVCKEKML